MTTDLTRPRGGALGRHFLFCFSCGLALMCFPYKAIGQQQHFQSPIPVRASNYLDGSATGDIATATRLSAQDPMMIQVVWLPDGKAIIGGGGWCH